MLIDKKTTAAAALHKGETRYGDLVMGLCIPGNDRRKMMRRRVGTATKFGEYCLYYLLIDKKDNTLE